MVDWIGVRELGGIGHRAPSGALGFAQIAPQTFGVDLSKNLIGGLYGFATLAYTFIGSPPGSDLHNSFGWSVGAAYAIVSPVAIFAFLDGATSISPWARRSSRSARRG